MGKLVYMITAVAVIQLAMVIFMNIGVPGSTLWDLWVNPQNWNNLSLLSIMTDSFLTIGLAAVVGTFFIKNDLMVFAGLAGIFFSFGIGLTTLWQQIASQPIFGDGGNLVASLVVSPIVFLYITTIIEFWRGRD